MDVITAERGTTGPRVGRFAPDAARSGASFIAAAKAYARGLTAHERRGLNWKPYDWSPGHPAYFGAMHQVLNALQAMALAPGSVIVEAGSGAGWLTRILCSLAYRVHCVEPSAELVRAAKRNLRRHLRAVDMAALRGNVRFHLCEMEAFRAPGLAADVVWFHESLHHVPDEAAALESAFRLLRPGGRLCLSGESNWIPGNAAQEAAWSAETARFGTLESPFTAAYLREALERAGFEDVVFHHGVNGWFPVGEADRPLGAAAGSSAEYENNVLARRPL